MEITIIKTSLLACFLLGGFELSGTMYLSFKDPGETELCFYLKPANVEGWDPIWQKHSQTLNAKQAQNVYQYFQSVPLSLTVWSVRHFLIESLGMVPSQTRAVMTHLWKTQPPRVHSGCATNCYFPSFSWWYQNLHLRMYPKELEGEGRVGRRRSLPSILQLGLYARRKSEFVRLERSRRKKPTA